MTEDIGAAPATGQAHGFPVWRDELGKPIACTEKIKVMRENLEEWIESTRDVFEDAVLIGCDETQIREFLIGTIRSLDNPYK